MSCGFIMYIYDLWFLMYIHVLWFLMYIHVLWFLMYIHFNNAGWTTDIMETM
jgi:hypothetical protein